MFATRAAAFFAGLSLLWTASTLDVNSRPCQRSFETMDSKWYEAEEVAAPESDAEPYQELFEQQHRREYEPAHVCTQSASLGIHAFVILQLKSALESVPEGGAVADIGSGTGFLLAEFATLTKKGVDVVGVELDSDAVASARRALPRTKESLPEVAKTWKDVPEVMHANALEFTYGTPFNVMNIGFASTQLPSRLLILAAEDVTMLMPICKQPLMLVGEKCRSKFHLFKRAGGKLKEQTVGPYMDFLYVPAAEEFNSDESNTPTSVEANAGSLAQDAQQITTTLVVNVANDASAPSSTTERATSPTSPPPATSTAQPTLETTVTHTPSSPLSFGTLVAAALCIAVGIVVLSTFQGRQRPPSRPQLRHQELSRL